MILLGCNISFNKIQHAMLWDAKQWREAIDWLSIVFFLCLKTRIATVQVRWRNTSFFSYCLNHSNTKRASNFPKKAATKEVTSLHTFFVSFLSRSSFRVVLCVLCCVRCSNAGHLLETIASPWEVVQPCLPGYCFILPCTDLSKIRWNFVVSPRFSASPLSSKPTVVVKHKVEPTNF